MEDLSFEVNMQHARSFYLGALTAFKTARVIAGNEKSEAVVVKLSEKISFFELNKIDIIQALYQDRFSLAVGKTAAELSNICKKGA